ncbi:MAG TPA: MarR family transcriptional regulator [Candidatus Limnocylindrales bacterium]|nr:MarR family transcriptional regulator [Candidatus Limnocylindrales bacterium]
MARTQHPARPPAATSRVRRRPEREISLPFDVFALSSRLGAYLDRALAGTGLRPVEYAVYSLMFEAGPRTPSELAAALGVPPSTMSGYLRPMLERGHARRIPNPADGRSFRVVLTDAGRGAHRAANPAFSGADQAILDALDRPSDEIRAAVQALSDAIDTAASRLDSDVDI